MNRDLNVFFALSLTLAGVASSQDSTKAAVPLTEQVTNVQGQVDGLNEDYLATKATVDKLAHLKVSGYIQAQYQLAPDMDSAAASTGTVGAFAGGAFPTAKATPTAQNPALQIPQRLQLRRVRLKTTYDAGTSQYVMEFEARPSGVVLKDAEVILKEPWLNTFALKLGLQDRPFGFEIPYSSSMHEAPERTRVYQTVFKDEKDLGANLEINPSEQLGPLSYFNLKGGLFTGTAAYNGGTGDEIDSTMDIIGRVGFKLPLNDLNLAIDGGVSYYAGKTLALNDSLYQMAGTALVDSVGAFVKKKGQTFDRYVIGVDLQTYYTIPVIGDVLGGTSLRGEYLSGKTIGTLSGINASMPYGASTAGMAQRNFMGWYVSWIQNWGTMFQSVLKYDVYDPNTDVAGSDIGVAANGKLGVGDLKWTTLGLGLIYYWDSNVKLTAYYDMITNEKMNGAIAATSPSYPYTSDLKDNVFTLRAQVKF